MNEVFVSISEESLSLQDLGGAEHGTSVRVSLGELLAQHASTFVRTAFGIQEHRPPDFSF